MREIPENKKNDPEPSMFGITPSYGFFVCHAKGITFETVEVSFEKEDFRPAFFLDDVSNIEFFRTNARLSNGAETFALKNVLNFSLSQSRYQKDEKFERVEKKDF